jgi:hypothetical protein
MPQGRCGNIESPPSLPPSTSQDKGEGRHVKHERGFARGTRERDKGRVVVVVSSEG